MVRLQPEALNESFIRLTKPLRPKNTALRSKMNTCLEKKQKNIPTGYTHKVLKKKKKRRLTGESFHPPVPESFRRGPRSTRSSCSTAPPRRPPRRSRPTTSGASGESAWERLGKKRNGWGLESVRMGGGAFGWDGLR